MSTVRITWVDSVTPGVTGHKIYRDDIEIADIGMAIQTYDDTTAVEDSTYKYEVQAYTATGESTDETLGVNMNNITTEIAKPSNEIYPDGNAESKWNEGNAVIGWTSSGANPLSVDSGDTAPYDGTYSLKAEGVGGSYDDIQLTFPVTDTKTYTVTGYAKRIDSASNTHTVRLDNQDGSYELSPITSSTWTPFSFVMVAVGTGNFTLKLHATNNAAETTSAYIDYVSILETA